jgi:ribosomal protein L40E
MTSPEEGRSNASGYLMLLIGIILIITGWMVVLGGYTTSVDLLFISMMIVQVIGIVIAFFGVRIIFDPSRKKAPAPSTYSEFFVVCERCGKEVPSGATSCPNCGNPIEWD